MGSKLRAQLRTNDRIRRRKATTEADRDLLLFLSTDPTGEGEQREAHAAARAKLRKRFERVQSDLGSNDARRVWRFLASSFKRYEPEADGMSYAMGTVRQILDQRRAEHGTEWVDSNDFDEESERSAELHAEMRRRERRKVNG